ncbi:MAG: hypothetical protein JWL96_1220 [Sphingomonas bacterium]|nr:hypothetical protein [Sphingomonas bacterium]
MPVQPMNRLVAFHEPRMSILIVVASSVPDCQLRNTASKAAKKLIARNFK